MDERKTRKRQIEMKPAKGRRKTASHEKKRKNNIKQKRPKEQSAANNVQKSEPLKKPKKYVSKKRIKRRNRFIAVFSIAVLLAAALATLSLTVFFPIKTIKITGCKIYEASEISAVIGVVKGDNLLLASEKRANSAVKSAYPYINTIEFNKSLPFTLNVNVKEYSVFTQIKFSSGYIRISEDGKVLEITDEFLKDIPVVTGVTVKEKNIGEKISFASDSGKEDIFSKTNEIISAFENSKIGEITLINFSDMQDIRITYNNQIVMLLGSSANLDKKLAHAKATLEARGDNKETGTLNLSRIPGAKNEASFIPRELQPEEIAQSKK